MIVLLHEKKKKTIIISAFATAKLFSHVVKQRVPPEREGEQNNVHNITDNTPREKKKKTKKNGVEKKHKALQP